VIHLAGEPIGLMQRCERCGIVILDYEDTSIAGENKRPMFFPPYRLVRQDDHSTTLVTEDEDMNLVRTSLCTLQGGR